MSDSVPPPGTRPNYVYPQFKDQTQTSSVHKPSSSSTSQRTSHAAPLMVSALPVQIQDDSQVDSPNEPSDNSNNNNNTHPPQTSEGANVLWKQRFYNSVLLAILAVVATAVGVFFIAKTLYYKANSSTRTSSVRESRIAFETTQELYRAVDLYLAGNLPPTLRYGPTIDTWDVSNVRIFDLLFSSDRNGAAAYFNSDLNSWDTGNAESMISMFSGTSQFNGDISSWNISSVRDTSYMFNNSYVFNGDVSNWDVSNVENMGHMFHYAKEFRGDVSRWMVGKVKNMDGVFYAATSFNSNIGNWDVSQVTTMSSMLKCAESFNQDISSWDVSNLQSAGYMFAEAKAFNQDLCAWASIVPVDATFEGSFSGTLCPNTTDAVVPDGPFCHNCDV